LEYGNNAAETWLSNDPYPADRVYGIPEEERQAWWGNLPSLDALQSENMHGAAAVAFLAGLASNGILAPEGDPRREAVMNEYPEAYQIGLEAEAANAAELQRGVEARAESERRSQQPTSGRGRTEVDENIPVETPRGPRGTESSTVEQLESNLEPWERQVREGGGGMAVLTKNLGNLRSEDNPYQSGTVSTGNGSYAVFDTYEDGLKGLVFDVKSKQHKDGFSSRVVGQGASVLDALKVYAPASDNNDPESYARFIVDNINERTGSSFTLDSSFSELPTDLLVEFIINKEDVALYRTLKEQGFFESNAMADIASEVRRSET